MRVHAEGKKTFLVVKKEGKWGIIDLNGTILLPIEYDKTKILEKEDDKIVWAVQKNGKWEVVSLS